MKKLLSALLGIFGLFIVPAYAALPDGYTQLEYIESTGTQYIDTGVNIGEDIQTKVRFGKTTNTFSRFGFIIGGKGNYQGLVSRTDRDSYYASMYNSSEHTLTRTITDDVFDFTFNVAGHKVVLNDTEIGTLTPISPYSTDGNVGVFRSPGTSSSNNNGIGKVYLFVITNSLTNVMLFNGIPAKRNSDGAVGLYDTVSGTFFGNKGSGEFVAGDPVTDTSCRNLFDANVVLGGTMSSNNGADGVPNPARARLEYLYLSAGTYTISNNGNTINQVIGASYSDDAGSNFSPIDVWNWHDLPFTFTLTSNRYVRFMVRNSSNVDLTNDNIGKFQFEQGDTATSYVPYCEKIKIATTKYNESAFGPLNTALANAISVVDSVVSNTITQAGRIATLQAQKQTRPNDIADDNEKCPAYKQCLLVEDENGAPHWYEITDPFRDFVAPIIANNVAPASTTNDAGYTQLEYIRSDAASWIDTGIIGTQDTAIETKFINLNSNSSTTVLIGDGWSNGSYLLSIVAQTGAPNRIGGLNNMLRDFWRTGKEFVVKMDKTGLYVNNSKINWNGSATNFTTTKPLYLLGDPAASGRNSYATLYYMKIYNNGTLVRDFVPVKRNSDSAIGMYDTVSKRFFGNKGTGTFTAGPTVANTDVPANGTWTATWAANATTGVAAGTVYGEGLCNGVSGTAKTPATSAQMSSANWSVDGASCWCRATGVDDGNDTTTVNGVWVFDYTYGSTGVCPGDCARDCTARINDTALFRKALLGM